MPPVVSGEACERYLPRATPSFLRRKERYTSAEAARTRKGRAGLRGAGDFAFLVCLDDVALLEVLVVLDADTALEAVADLAHVFFEATQRRDLTLPDDRAFSQEAHLRTTRDDARGDV